MTALDNNVKPNWENPDFKPNMELKQLLGDFIHESAETRTAKKKTNQSFRADRAGRFGEMARHLVQRFTTRNSHRTTKGGN